MNREECLWREIALIKRQLAALRNETGLALRQANKTGRDVLAVYSSSTSRTMTNGVFTLVNYEDKIVDTHDAVATGAGWAFTCPDERSYTLFGGVRLTSATTWDIGDTLMVAAYKNGAILRNLGVWVSGAASGTNLQAAVYGSTPEYCVKGDTISFYVLHNSGGDINLNGAPTANWCAVYG